MSPTSRKPKASPRFADQARIFVQGGNGGNGALTFRREKYVPRGGPDGGDGGRGGNVIFEADSHLRTLIDFLPKHHYAAPSGDAGKGKRRHGSDGKDITILVPPGTMIRRDEDKALLADLTHPGDSYLAAKGGKGGRGNSHFATPVRRVPRFAEMGEEGQARWLWLELRLLADVGVIGLPNAGKSTLISQVSAARPKIAPYPFTTLAPVLGVVSLSREKSFVIADMPGLIEGAHSGQGLGHDFLRHIERTRLLVHMLDISAPEGEPLKAFEMINKELFLHRAWLADLPQLVALNKTDLPEGKQALPKVKKALRAKGYEVFAISALTGEGLSDLVKAIAKKLDEITVKTVALGSEEEIAKEPAPAPLEVLEVKEGVFRVTGADIERQAKILDPENEEAVTYLRRRLGQKGVLRLLARKGARPGDKIILAGHQLEYRD